MAETIPLSPAFAGMSGIGNGPAGGNRRSKDLTGHSTDEIAAAIEKA